MDGWGTTETHRLTSDSAQLGGNILVRFDSSGLLFRPPGLASSLHCMQCVVAGTCVFSFSRIVASFGAWVCVRKQDACVYTYVRGCSIEVTLLARIDGNVSLRPSRCRPKKRWGCSSSEERCLLTSWWTEPAGDRCSSRALAWSRSSSCSWVRSCLFSEQTDDTRTDSQLSDGMLTRVSATSNSHQQEKVLLTFARQSMSPMVADCCCVRRSCLFGFMILSVSPRAAARRTVSCVHSTLLRNVYMPGP